MELSTLTIFFALRSDQNQTALVEQLSGSVSGDVTVEQYFENDDGYHFLATPVSGATLSELNDDINLNMGTPSPNIYIYDETDQSPEYMDGWIPLSSISTNLAAGVGYTFFPNYRWNDS